jgi:integrase/recombinase XerD
MSGGPYGRGKAPERACLPLEQWPDEDRKLWQAACAPADPLDEHCGARAQHSATANRNVEKGYGRWLTFLHRTDPACLDDVPANRITPERVQAYVACLVGLQNSTAAILSRLKELGAAAKVMGPAQDWRFLNRLSSKVRARHKPVRDKSNLKLSDELLDLGLSLIDRATEAQGLTAALLHRDGLLIAFLSLVPLRRRNIAGLRIGQNMVDVKGRWLIALDVNETKTRAPLEIAWPEELAAPLVAYLTIHRPRLCSLHGRRSKPIDRALWVSSLGSPMTEMAIYHRIRKHTHEAFGAAINPHLFRDAAATTLAIADPENVRVAAPLLGHRTFTTTERYYQQAKSFEAHRQYIAALFGNEKVR